MLRLSPEMLPIVAVGGIFCSPTVAFASNIGPTERAWHILPPTVAFASNIGPTERAWHILPPTVAFTSNIGPTERTWHILPPTVAFDALFALPTALFATSFRGPFWILLTHSDMQKVPFHF